MNFYDLLESKVVSNAEVVVILFEHCNLKCVFCPQDHTSIQGASREEILSKVDPIAKWINSSSRDQSYKLHIMGGELFQDSWVDKGFLELYQEFIDQLIHKTNSDLYFNFVTNLVFDRKEEVRDFLEKNNLKVSISYDPSGRFNLEELKTFISNLSYFENYIEMVSLVGTRQNMKHIIEGDELFDKLYEKYVCDFDHFLPNVKTSKQLIPSEQELFDFNKVLIDKYPKCLTIEHFVTDKPAKRMTCTRGNSFTILPDNTIPEGCSGAVYLKEGKTKNPFGTQIVENFINKYNCFQCEFYQRCPMPCFIKEDYKHIKEDMDECVIKETFRYADSIYKPTSR